MKEPSYIHNNGMCTAECDHLLNTKKCRDICDLTGQKVSPGKTECIPHKSNVAKGMSSQAGNVGVLYGWMPPHSEAAQGPFDSKEAAIEDAKDYYDGEATIYVGTCKYADPLDYLPDVESLLEQMDENAFDNDFAWYDNGDIFYCTETSKKAEEGLRRWAKKYLRAEKIWTLVEIEKVDL